jgi:hypothetical protein
MTYVKTDEDGRIEAIYRGLKRDTDVWVDVDSHLLDERGELYLIAEATQPESGWDKEDGVIGVVQS